MKELIYSFYKNYNDFEVKECVITFLETAIELIEKEGTIHELIKEVTIIDHLNKQIAKDSKIEFLCSLYKSKIFEDLFKDNTAPQQKVNEVKRKVKESPITPETLLYKGYVKGE